MLLFGITCKKDIYWKKDEDRSWLPANGPFWAWSIGHEGGKHKTGEDGVDRSRHGCDSSSDPNCPDDDGESPLPINSPTQFLRHLWDGRSSPYRTLCSHFQDRLYRHAAFSLPYPQNILQTVLLCHPTTRIQKMQIEASCKLAQKSHVHNIHLFSAICAFGRACKPNFKR